MGPSETRATSRRASRLASDDAMTPMAEATVDSKSRQRQSIRDLWQIAVGLCLDEAHEEFPRYAEQRHR